MPDIYGALTALLGESGPEAAEGRYTWAEVESVYGRGRGFASDITRDTMGLGRLPAKGTKRRAEHERLRREIAKRTKGTRPSRRAERRVLRSKTVHEKIAKARAAKRRAPRLGDELRRRGGGVKVRGDVIFSAKIENRVLPAFGFVRFSGEDWDRILKLWESEDREATEDAFVARFTDPELDEPMSYHCPAFEAVDVLLETDR